MSTHPRSRRRFDDPASRRRRWGGLDADARRAAAAADPVGFVADHLPRRDRHDGTVVVLLRRDDAGGRRAAGGLVCPLPGTAEDPTPVDCADLLAPFVAAAPAAEATGLGLVRHRCGPDEPTPADHRWRAALRAAAVQAGLVDHGLAVRTAEGALLRL